MRVCPARCVAGGVPNDRRLDRHERPATARAPTFFDGGPDWAARWVAAGAARPDYHLVDHFVEAYSEELVELLRARGGGVPSQEDAWKDMKVHEGRRGDLRGVYAAALAESRGRATAESIVECERACMRARGARYVSED